MLAVRDTRDTSDLPLTDYSSRVACAVDLACTTDASLPSPVFGEDDWEVEHLGGTREEVPVAYEDVSPLAFVDEQSAPTLVIHGTADTIVPAEHSRLLAAALEHTGVEVVYIELDEVDHFTVADWTRNGPHVLDFLDRHLDPER
jgi:dipeptidyl aminopeptidase/acylaminoacyl peptidase